MNLFRLIFLFFLIIPFLEIYLMVKIGGVIGALPTIGLLVVTAVAGVMLLRIQGLSTLKRLMDTLSRQEIPAQEIVEGSLLLLGGALLLTPGFFTDVMGFLLLVPHSRERLAAYLLASRFRVGGPRSGMHRQETGAPGGTTIEGQFKREDGPPN
jgi:UPF0716 protein FxsA